MRIAVAALQGHPTDPSAWSGTAASIVAALEERPDVSLELVGPVGRVPRTLGRAISSLSRRLGPKINWETEPLFLGSITRSLRRALRRTAACDVVITLGWTPLVTNDMPPTMYWGDATNAQRVDDAPHWSNLSRRSRRQLPLTEQAALRSLSAILMSSQWSAGDVVSRYRIDPAKVHVVPFGSNMSKPTNVNRSLSTRPVRLLLVGVDWHRKGIDTAVLATDIMRSRGHEVMLDVLGAEPPDGSWARSNVHYHGFLSKAVPSEHARLGQLFDQAHLFLLPSRHDPSPIVLAEAAAHGLPVIAAGVGGIPERIDPGRSGFVLPIGASPSEFADAIEGVVKRPERYASLVAGAVEFHATALSWASAIDQMIAIARDLQAPPDPLGDRSPAAPA